MKISKREADLVRLVEAADMAIALVFREIGICKYHVCDKKFPKDGQKRIMALINETLTPYITTNL